VARVRALEQSRAGSQQLRSDLLQTQTELAATRSELLKAQTDLTAACSDLAEFKGSVDKRLGEQTSHRIARETAVKDGLQQQVNAGGSSLEHLSQRIRANNIVLHGVPDIAAHSRPADLTRYVSNKLDTAIPRRGSPSQALSQSIRAVSHIGRPGSGKRAVLVEFSTNTAKHEAFKLSPHLRRSGLHLADELTPKQLKAQKGLEADFSALKIKGFRPFYRRGELKYRDQGVNRTCKKGEAIRVSALISPSRASPAPRAPPGPPPRGPTPGRQGVRTSLPGHPNPGSTAGGGPSPGQGTAAASSPAPPGPPPRGPAPGRQGVRTSLPGHPNPGSTAGGGPSPGQGTAAASTSAAIAAANAASAAAANAMAGDGDTEMPAPRPGPGTGPSALAPSQ